VTTEITDKDLLWPERWSVEDLQEKRKFLGARQFELMYQCTVQPEEGDMFKSAWWQYARVVNDPAESAVVIGEEKYVVTSVYQSADTAHKEKTTNSYSVISTWGTFQLGYILLDIWRKHVPYYRLKAAAKTLGEYWSPRIILIEDKASGISLIQDLRHGTNLPVVPWPSDNDKTARAESVTPFFQSKRVWIRKDAPWAEDYTLELEVFPNGAYDDQVDVTTQFLNYIREAEKRNAKKVKAKVR